MQNFSSLTEPQALTASVGAEARDFSVRALRAEPLSVSIRNVAFGVVWTAMAGAMAFLVFIAGTPKGARVPVAQGIDPVLLFMGCLIALFICIGVAATAIALRRFLRPAPYFVGTPTRLVVGEGNSVRSISWAAFSGEISARGDESFGTVVLGLKSVRMEVGTIRAAKEVPSVFLIGIAQPFEVERACRKRIAERAGRVAEPTAGVY